jgi:hypothetical protein
MFSFKHKWAFLGDEKRTCGFFGYMNGDGWMDGCMDGWMDEWMDEWMDNMFV